MPERLEAEMREMQVFFGVPPSPRTHKNATMGVPAPAELI